jgi:hypothetical protein
VKDLLQNSRLAPWLRPQLPLLYAAGRIVAVPGLWVAPQIAAAAGETRRARLRWTPAAEEAPCI